MKESERETDCGLDHIAVIIIITIVILFIYFRHVWLMGAAFYKAAI